MCTLSHVYTVNQLVNYTHEKWKINHINFPQRKIMHVLHTCIILSRVDILTLVQNIVIMIWINSLFVFFSIKMRVLLH